MPYLFASLAGETGNAQLVIFVEVLPDLGKLLANLQINGVQYLRTVHRDHGDAPVVFVFDVFHRTTPVVLG